MMKKYLFLLCLWCQYQGLVAQALYFPPLVGSTWSTTAAADLGWCTDKIDSLYNFLDGTNTKGFIVLKDGKIVLEKYFKTFTQDSFWYWASAGKTMTALMVGVAQQKGLLKLSDTSSKYLGSGWTSLGSAQEDKISIYHQLSMTSGLDDGLDKDCTADSCLLFKAEAGTRWAYHNAPYTLLDKVIESASGRSFQQYYNTEIRNKTGINGIWTRLGNNNVLLSNPRSMARFGLLMLNQGKWDQTGVLNDTQYFNAMVNSSQNLNLSYGYLTWLNGKGKAMFPGSQIVFNTDLAPNAPKDMYAAMGKNGQLINVVPSQNLVVVRVGDAPGDNGEVPVTFNNDIWKYLNKVICAPSTGISVIETLQNLKLYPNPTSFEINLNGVLAHELSEVSLYNLQGGLIQSFEPNLKLSVAGIPSGIYLLKISTQNSIGFVKLVKE
jgi:CubicO group peptidase (beta-lactamase class C family)